MSKIIKKLCSIWRRESTCLLLIHHYHETTCLETFADSSFAYNGDPHFHLEYIVVLCDSAKSHFGCYSSKKSRRIERYTLCGEVHAFPDDLYCTFSIKHDLEQVSRRSISLKMSTDSKPLFDIISTWFSTEEKRLMIDIRSARKPLDLGAISNIRPPRPVSSSADVLTKVKTIL